MDRYANVTLQFTKVLCNQGITRDLPECEMDQDGKGSSLCSCSSAACREPLCADISF